MEVSKTETTVPSVRKRMRRCAVVRSNPAADAFTVGAGDRRRTDGLREIRACRGLGSSSGLDADGVPSGAVAAGVPAAGVPAASVAGSVSVAAGVAGVSSVAG